MMGHASNATRRDHFAQALSQMRIGQMHPCSAYQVTGEAVAIALISFAAGKICAVVHHSVPTGLDHKTSGGQTAPFQKTVSLCVSAT